MEARTPTQIRQARPSELAWTLDPRVGGQEPTDQAPEKSIAIVMCFLHKV